jgi:hypothetical protein
LGNNRGSIGFGASSHDFSMRVIIDDRGDLGIAGNMLLAGKSAEMRGRNKGRDKRPAW